jgi:hypothetical protein
MAMLTTTYGRIAYRFYPARYFNPLISVWKICKNLKKKAIEGTLREIQKKRCRSIKDRTRKELYPEFCAGKNNYSGPVYVPGVFFRGKYLKITRNSNGVNNMNGMNNQIYQNHVHQTEGTITELTYPGALY